MSVLIGKPAPDFTAAAVLGDGSIVGDLNFTEARGGKYAWVVFIRWISPSYVLQS